MILILQRKNKNALSDFLSRIPVNAVDKLIAVFAGYGLYILIEKMARKANLVSE